jgi:ABC-type uncharacterized transport system permease subunit
MTNPTPALTANTKAWVGFAISLLLSILTAVSQMLTDGTTKNVLLVVGIALTSIGTGLGVWQATNAPKL